MKAVPNEIKNKYFNIVFYNNTVNFIRTNLNFDYYYWVFNNNGDISCNHKLMFINNSNCERFKNQIKKYFELSYEQFTPEVLEELTNLLFQFKKETLNHHLLQATDEIMDEIRHLGSLDYCVLIIQEPSGNYEIMQMPRHGEYLDGYLDGIKRGGITRYLIGIRIVLEEPHKIIDGYQIIDECDRVLRDGSL